LKDIKNKILVFLAFIILKLLYFTYRIKVTGSLYDKAALYVFWHGKMFIMIPFLGYKKTVALVSKSEDGELITNVLKYFKYEFARGSSSRDGEKALIQLIKKLKHGKSAAITPDGPRGPAKVFQKGAVYIALKSNVPIIPISYNSSRSCRFSSWDKFEVPYPFSKVNIKIGKPVYFKEGGKKNIIKYCNKLEKRLKKLEENKKSK